MYEFVDLHERGAASTSLSIQTIFNGINLDEVLTDESGGFTTLTVSGRGNVTNRLFTTEIPGKDGLLESNEYTSSEREIVVKYKITDRTNEGFRLRFNKLNDLLKGTKNELVFSDEDASFYATLSGNEVPEENSNTLIASLTFLCSNPRKYGPEKTITLNTSSGTIANVDGTASTKPIFELEVNAPITFAMVSTGDEYMVIGRPADIEEELVDTKTMILEEEGTSLGSWSEASTMVDVGEVSGRFETDGIGITVPDYGLPSDSRWHGPALIKEIPVIQDFEIEMLMDVRTINSEETFRIECYLFDENFNVLGKVGIKDNGLQLHRKKGVGRIGSELGGTTNYLISSENYEYNWDTFNGMVRMRRVGKRFEFYITRVSNAGNHVNSQVASYYDSDGSYQGLLKYIQIHIGKYSGTEQAYTPRIDSIRVFQLHETNVDQTPYIANVGDKIVMNHRTRELLLNGERVAKGDFGSRPFNLSPGENTLVLLPENGLRGIMKYRPAY
ncbi:hypothetical protein F0342_21655 [Bacillus sp. CH30_1T]|uniref:distal tail protein Dit n=1 Tax=Bacillus sp. CH30_1T TaxID=2604836 RepID=UPI0011EF93E4|nr:distal tail protein Dit [Bacillus sp. CH30_1T]KAA0560770.1 hypothetical protein F0342_21655 [Bacillus sp. CH30_1T]